MVIFSVDIIKSCYDFQVHCTSVKSSALSFHGKVVVARVASVRRHQELPPCQAEPVPTDFKTDPPLAKAEPISNVGYTSVIACLRKGKKPLCNNS